MAVPIPPPHEPPVVSADRGSNRFNDVWYRFLERLGGSTNLNSTNSRRKLTEDETFFVITSTGSDDTGDGTTARPFATPQGAYDYLLANIDANGYFVKIRMQESSSTTFTSTSKRRTTDEFSSDTTVLTINANIVGCPCVEFEGPGMSGNDFSNQIIKWDANGGHCVFLAAESGLYRFQNIAFIDSAVSKGSALIFAFNTCTISINECDFGAGGNYHIHTGPNTVLKLFGDYSISGGTAVAHLLLEAGALVDHEDSIVTLTNTPDFGTAYIRAHSDSAYAAFGVTFSGSATGPRFLLTNSAFSIGNELDDELPGDEPGESEYVFNEEAVIKAHRVGPLTTGTDSQAFIGGDYGSLITIQNLGTTSSGLFYVDAGNTVTKIAGDASFEASTTPAAGNNGFEWGGSNYRIYNNTGLTRTYSVMVLMCNE